MEYIIIHSDNIPDLMEMVSDFLKRGFIPCGGVVIDKDGMEYLQAMYLSTTVSIIYPQPTITPPYKITYGDSFKVR